MRAVAQLMCSNTEGRGEGGALLVNSVVQRNAFFCLLFIFRVLHSHVKYFDCIFFVVVVVLLLLILPSAPP